MRKSTTFCLTLAVICSWGTGQRGVRAQGIESQTAQLPAPRVVTATSAAMSTAPPNSRQYGDRKQNELGLHFRPTIDLVPTVGIQAAAAPAVSQTNVVGGPIRAATDLEFLRNHPLTDTETNDITSTVGEPSVATRGDEVLVTGNWFAAFSTNGGASFGYVNPDTTFPVAENGERFCCDQVAIYDPVNDVMFWYLQYISNSNGNTGRLAVATGSDITTQSWRYYDFTPQSVGNWSGEWFDYPDLALSDNFLYITSNVFSASTDSFTRAVVLRLPLSSLAAYQTLTYSYYDTNQVASIRPTQGATDTMYMGAHRNLTSIRVFTWPEGSTTVNQVDVPVQAWSGATRVAPGPDGKDWLGRADGRITAAALAGNNIALGWTAAQDSAFPFPHVRFALIDKNSQALVAEPHIWSQNLAYAYPAAAPNAASVLGISVHFGGGAQFHPSHAVGVLDESGGLSWNLIASAIGTDGPATNRWGDYLAVRPHGANPDTWVATGFTLQGGDTRNDIEPTYLHFGLDGHGEDDCEEKLERLQRELAEIRETVRQLLARMEALE